jgi:hypothetical protein
MRVPFRSAEVGPNREETHRVDSDRTTGPGLGARFVEGGKAGLVATLVMTAYRLPISRSLPPTAEFWAKFVSGGDPDDHPVAAIALHLLYGAGGGMAFGAITPLGSERTSSDDSRETAQREAVGLLWGVVYSAALSIFGERVVLGRLLGMDLDVDESLVFHAGHLVYGLTLGTMYGSRTSDEE